MQRVVVVEGGVEEQVERHGRVDAQSDRQPHVGADKELAEAGPGLKNLMLVAQRPEQEDQKVGQQALPLEIEQGGQAPAAQF